ncbi:TonB-dependent receptor plug domain-containing protein [Vibrio penaeicida]|uniref:TonB-dependent receptor plug domain-containing protein n=1 Tax=Vibrio penaeicida TaxID=104609 RepID=UPI000CEA2EDB|nr:TonB-dependent receptor [Vibrio penaeicida]
MKYVIPLFLLSAPFTAFAENDELVEKVTVVGNAAPQDEAWAKNTEVFEQSFSSEYIGRQELDEKSVGDIKEALRGVSNVRVTDQGAFSKQVSIRGLSGERVLYVVDGIKISNQGMTHSGGGEGNLNDINTVESIEVIKGSPAVVYDPGASGGIVNIKTQQNHTEDHLKGAVKLGYDDGYEKTSQHAGVSTAYNGFGLRVSGSKNVANDYKVADKDKLDKTLGDSNLIQEREGDDQILDLGYKDKAAALNVFYDGEYFGRMDISYATYQGEDINFTHGSSDGVFRTDELERDSVSATYRLPQFYSFQNVIVSYNRSEIKSVTNAVKNTLTSDTFGLRAELNWLGGDHIFGGELIKDTAENKVSASQDYYAAFWSSNWYFGDLTVTPGIRFNHWKINKTFRKGENKALRCQLEGLLGCLPEQTDSTPTYSLGAVYSLTPNQNVTFNYAKTHRQPSVYERVAFDHFRGCFDNCEAESADNYELAWKYLNDGLFLSAAVFQNDFSSYINTKEKRALKNQAALELCIQLGKCDPLTGDFNNQERDFFDTHIEFYNAKDVTNKGVELLAHHQLTRRFEIQGNLSYNEMSSDDPFVGHQSRPWELMTEATYRFDLPDYRPWIKLNARWVTDKPEVKQVDGFDAFDLYNLYFGFSYKAAKLNAGVRNLTNKVYHEPYGALDGLGRSFFANLTLSY